MDQRLFKMLFIASILLTSATHAQKSLHFFSPWDYTPPQIVINGKPQTMIADYAHCGWYTTEASASDFSNVYFTNKYDSTYGESGTGDSEPIKTIDEVLTTASDAYLYFKTTQSYTVETTRQDPLIPGSCLIGKLKGEFFDWKEYDLDSAFQDVNPNCGHTIGLVNTTLNSDGLPVPNLTHSSVKGCKTSKLTEWFQKHPTEDNTMCQDLDLKMDTSGIFGLDSFTIMYATEEVNPIERRGLECLGLSCDSIKANTGFFPLDTFINYGNQKGESYDSRWDDVYVRNWGASLEFTGQDLGYQHNYHFCMKTHTTFTYSPGQSFVFEGDDDLWIFVDSVLALDIGGTHLPIRDTLQMDDLFSTSDKGSTHSFDLFYCERSTLASNLKIQTDIDFAITPQYGYTTENGINYKITSGIEYKGGCQSNKIIIDSTSTFYFSTDDILDIGVDSLLNPDETHFGGITIDKNQQEFTIDLSNITGLTQGETYYLWFRSITTIDGKEYKRYVKFTVPEFLPYDIVFVDAAGAPISSDPITLPINEEQKFYVKIIDKELDGTDFDCTACGDNFELRLPDGYDTRIKEFQAEYSDNLYSFIVAADNGVIELDSIRIEVTYTGEGTRQNTIQKKNSPKIIFERIINPYIIFAEIYDNGTYSNSDKQNEIRDGVADSLVVSIGNWEGEPKELTLCIGRDESNCTETVFTPDDWSVAAGDSTLIITQNFEYPNAGEFTDVGGTATAFFYEDDGERVESTKKLDDKMGPIIIKIEIKKDPKGIEDLLRVTFSEKVKDIKADDYVFIVDDQVVKVKAVINNGENDIWDFLLDIEDNAEIVPGDIVSLNPESGLTDIVENPPGNPNKGVEVTVIGQDPIPSENGNFFLDIDGDGTMDRILLSFVIPVHDQDLSPIRTKFEWVDAENNTITLSPDGSEWIHDPNDEYLAYWDIPASKSIRPHTTSFLEDAFKSADVTYTPTEGGSEITYSIIMSDGMPAVLISAEIYQGTTQDTLYLTLSEPVLDDKMFKDGAENYRFKHRTGGLTDTIVTAESSVITNGDANAINILHYGIDSKRNYQISPGDTVKMVNGLDRIMDLAGNIAGEASRGVPVIGKTNAITDVVKIQSFNDPDFILNRWVENDNSAIEKKSFVPDHSATSEKSIAEQASEAFGQVGFIQSGNMLDLLLAEIQESELESIHRDSLKNHLKFAYKLTIFSTIGEYVASKAEVISCNDVIFSESNGVNPIDPLTMDNIEEGSGDCTNPENDRWLWIAWNPVADNGRLVGTGVYIAIFENWYQYPGGATSKLVRTEKVAYIRETN